MYTIPNAYSQPYSYDNSNAFGYADWNAARDADAENCAKSEASPYSSTTPIT